MKYEVESMNKVEKYATLMKLYDESEPEYLSHKKEWDCMFERATEYRQECNRMHDRMKRLSRQLDRLSK